MCPFTDYNISYIIIIMLLRGCHIHNIMLHRYCCCPRFETTTVATVATTINAPSQQPPPPYILTITTKSLQQFLTNIISPFVENKRRSVTRHQTRVTWRPNRTRHQTRGRVTYRDRTEHVTKQEDASHL